MSVDLPEPLAERLAAEAARRGVTVEGLALEAIEGRDGPGRPAQPGDDESNAVKAFIGCFDSGDPDWATTDTHLLRAHAAERRPA